MGDDRQRGGTRRGLQEEKDGEHCCSAWVGDSPGMTSTHGEVTGGRAVAACEQSMRQGLWGVSCKFGRSAGPLCQRQ